MYMEIINLLLLLLPAVVILTFLTMKPQSDFYSLKFILVTKVHFVVGSVNLDHLS